MRKQPRLRRTKRLLRRKLSCYLATTVLISASASCHEFVDSIVVSHLLGPDAMAVITLGTPVMYAISFLYVLLGSGGAALYAVSLGRLDRKTAGQSLSFSLGAALAPGLMLCAGGRLFLGALTEALCSEAQLIEPFRAYLSVLLLCAPLMIVIQTLLLFLPSAGKPGAALIITVTANVLNICLDLLLIRTLHMGVEGAAWALLFSYCIAAFLSIACIASHKGGLFFSKDWGAFRKTPARVIRLGCPDAVTQLGFALKFTVCNLLSMTLAGTDGVVAYSLCMQTVSIVSMLIVGLMDACMPMIAVLHGERDYKGEEWVLKFTMLCQFLLAAGMTLVLECVPQEAASLYSITEAQQLSASIHALRIFALVFLPRNAVIVFFRYLNLIGKSSYAGLVSLLDGFLTIPAALILSRFLGIDGLWWSYPLSAAALLLFVAFYNQALVSRSHGALHGVLLIEKPRLSRPLLDVTISDRAEDISGLSRELQGICEKRGFSPAFAMRTALVLEELAVYIANKKRSDSYMDVLVYPMEQSIEIRFRSVGVVFNPHIVEADDLRLNMQLLIHLASEIDNESVMGMNITRLVLNRPQCSPVEPGGIPQGSHFA